MQEERPAMLPRLANQLLRALIERGTEIVKMGYEEDKSIDELVKGAVRLSELRYGGLIVIERSVGLKNIIETGRILNAEISSDLLTTVFTPYTPLHDGAVIIRGNRVAAAGCFFPGLDRDPGPTPRNDCRRPATGTHNRPAVSIAGGRRLRSPRR